MRSANSAECSKLYVFCDGKQYQLKQFQDMLGLILFDAWVWLLVLLLSFWKQLIPTLALASWFLLVDLQLKALKWSVQVESFNYAYVSYYVWFDTHWVLVLDRLFLQTQMM
jgi:hypothetical protein